MRTVIVQFEDSTVEVFEFRNPEHAIEAARVTAERFRLAGALVMITR